MTAEGKKVGVAIIGSGYWGINYVRVFNELPNARVAAVCDARQERLDEVQRRFPGLTVSPDLDEVLQMPDVEAAVICTGATSHYAVASRCLEAGKHLLVEKPMATTVPDSLKLIGLAEKQGVILMVGHTFLYNPGVRKVKEYIAEDKMGRVYYLYSRRTNLGPIRYDVNSIWDLAPHDISIFNYLMESTPLWVSAVGSNILNNTREDVGFVTLGYPDNVLGNIHVSWADPNKVRELVVVGSKQRVVFDDLNALERVKIYQKGVTPSATKEASSFGEFQFLIRDGDILSPRVEISEPLKNQCKHFLECIATGDRPLTDGWDGLRVVQVLQAIDRSVAQNGAPVFIDHESLRISYEITASRNGHHSLPHQSHPVKVNGHA